LIVHRDIKPRNVLVPGGIPGLSKLKLLDFGIAGALRRAGSDRLTLDDDDAEVLLGTPAYMAPELFVSRGRPGTTCDVYSAGLLLFELLGAGPLFPGATDQTSARLESDASLGDRVPEPLASLLGRMLSRDPKGRFANAGEALAVVLDMATAPVQSVISVPPPSLTTIPPPDVAEKTYVARVHRLPPDPLAAFELALGALDIPCLEAVARRHRGAGDVGRVARALALALRLELDAAAMVLEPRLSESALARAVARCVVWPRARRATRARLEGAGDDWVADVPPSLAARLVSLAVGLTTMQDAEQNAKMSARIAARCTAGSAERATAEAAHVASARLASRSHADISAFRRLAAKGERDALGEATRALGLGMLSFRIDDRIARAELERAAAWGCESGATLLEVRALLAWGGLLVEAPDRMADGLLLLERASMLLADGDSPGLEHIAVHNGGVAMLVAGRYEEAAPFLARARETSHEEGLLENEVLSGAIELAVLVCAPEPKDMGPALATVADDRVATVTPRAAGLAHVARAVHELRFGTLERMTEEVRRALKHASDPGGGDAYLLAEAMGALLAAAHDDTVDLLARASDLERLARDRGFASFYWFDVLATVLRLAPPFPEQAALGRALERLVLLLGPLKA
jgi:serine/threonine-protein kinase